MRESNRAVWGRLSPLLDRALDLDPAARHDLVASLRSDEPSVADALERLLAEHDRVAASDFLETAPFAPAAPMAGRSVGGYTLVRPLGAGGMGTVWLAARSDGRFEGHVALKFLNLSGLDDAARERFRREGRSWRGCLTPTSRGSSTPASQTRDNPFWCWSTSKEPASIATPTIIGSTSGRA